MSHTILQYTLYGTAARPELGRQQLAQELARYTMTLKKEVRREEARLLSHTAILGYWENKPEQSFKTVLEVKERGQAARIANVLGLNFNQTAIGFLDRSFSGDSFQALIKHTKSQTRAAQDLCQLYPDSGFSLYGDTIEIIQQNTEKERGRLEKARALLGGSLTLGPVSFSLLGLDCPYNENGPYFLDPYEIGTSLLS